MEFCDIAYLFQKKLSNLYNIQSYPDLLFNFWKGKMHGKSRETVNRPGIMVEIDLHLVTIVFGGKEKRMVNRGTKNRVKTEYMT